MTCSASLSRKPQAPFDGDNIYDSIVAGKYEFPKDVDVSDDAKVRLGNSDSIAQS
jgi:hypothetical protein